MTPVVVGIDPGLTGAVGVLSLEGQPVELHDAPVVAVVKGGSRRMEADVAGMADLLRKIGREYEVRRVVLEKPQPMPSVRRKGQAVVQDGKGEEPGWGGVANFSLGHGYGLWLGIVVALRLPLERVSPQGWRAKLLPGLEKGKEATRAQAMTRWPGVAEELRFKKNHGRSDALWLAEYGRRLA